MEAISTGKAIPVNGIADGTADKEGFMSVDDNKHTVKQFCTYLYNQDFEKAFALMSPDATWWVPSDQPGGTTVSIAVMRPGIGSFFGAFAQPPTFEFGRVTAEGQRVCLEQTSRSGRTHGGVDYGNDYLMLFQFKNGLIVEVREYMNPILAAPVMIEMSEAARGVAAS